jgi:membrane fusion protein, heavy metal efflux system
MQTRSKRRFSRGSRWGLALLLLIVIAAAATVNLWMPKAREFLGKAPVAASHAKPTDHAAHGDEKAHVGEAESHEGEEGGEHGDEKAHADETGAHKGEKGDEHGHEEEAGADEHDHAHETAKPPVYDHPHDEAATVKLSAAAQKNIGLRTAVVKLGPFERTMSVPGVVVERPGWSIVEVTAPMTGVVTHIYPIQGEAVRPGQPLFEVRLTHEDLLQAQTEFLRTVEELNVIAREVARLEKATNDGLIAGKSLLERKYEQQKQEASLRAQRQALLLHGLSKSQVAAIESTRTLLQSLTIRAPSCCGVGASGSAKQAAPPKDEAVSPECLLQVQQLKAVQGKHVVAGDMLCALMDNSVLYIEGMAFEQDIAVVNRAAAARHSVSAVLGSKSSGDEETVRGLRILYLDDKVDRESRAFHFFVTLPNHLLRQDATPDGHRFVYWQFKPGQRTQIRIPVERWTDRIVLPVEAVAQEGAESYVFESNDGHFDRRSVHVEYRDQESVVVANDGVLKPGKTVVVMGAYQMHLAMKNKAGGAPDPHAGHNH